MPPTEPDFAIEDVPVPRLLQDDVSYAPVGGAGEAPAVDPGTAEQGPTSAAPEADLSTEVESRPADVPEPSPLYAEKPEPSDPEISKPLDSLETPDPYTPSVFDSVRIMEPSMGQPQDFIDTRLGPNAIRPSAGLEPPTPEIISNPQPTEEPRPYTAPNIGLGDTDGKRSAKLKPLAEGTVLNGRYEIVRKIGGGGMGAVYLASDNNLGGVLRAVKEMVQAHIEEEQQEKAINDFKRESMILSTLDHPSIPTIFDYFYDQEEGRFYLVMKYISGGDLAARLRAAPEGKIDESTVTDWAIQVTDVLDYLHNQPSTIVYRDLKPSNIMIDGNTGRVMLIDFGIARSIGQKQEKGVTAVGTMGYAPPELFSGNVEPRSDIYSLGSTMFHLLTGADPQSNPLLIFDFQKNPRPRQINPRLSDQMERVLMRAVEYNADSRFLSALEMKQVLEDHLAKLKVGAVTYGVSEAPTAVGLADQSVFCGFCGQRIVATDLFCAFCGAKQPIAQQGVHSEIYIKPTSTAKLVVEGTSDLAAPTFSLLKDDNLLGRRDPM
jgi:serine/threonine-protein kinase